MEVDWNPSRDAEPTIDDAVEWAETARDFCGLARDAILGPDAGQVIGAAPADRRGQQVRLRASSGQADPRRWRCRR